MAIIKYQTLGELKQALSRDYNDINVALFDTGASTLRIDIFDNKILIVAVNKRVLALERIGEDNPLLSAFADYSLIKTFKRYFAKTLTEKYGFLVQHVFKDYDAKKSCSATLAILDDDVERYLQLES